LQAQWSPDEEKLLFLGKTGDSGYLSLYSHHKVEQLCDIRKIGPLGGIAISSDGEKAFLLAAISGQLNVWMMALPAKPPA
jgi:hypothetical protein